MRYRWWIWSATLLLSLVAIIGTRIYPYFPLDLAVARLVQRWSPNSPHWAHAVTATAKAPWNVVLVGICISLAWWKAGWRGGLLALASFLGVWLMGPELNTWIGRARPSAELIRVVGSPSGSSAPSIFGLTYGAVFLFLGLLALFSKPTRGRRSLLILCGLVLIVGACARIALGAHWPSDLVLSYLIAGCWAGLLLLAFPVRR